ncbi:MAG: cobalamin transport system ATP-binding protein [Solirubrobacterales bacterium]|nr:cobalamin transport system ATP-binding protein [Solirubrobacterales bacterium]
MIALDRVSVRLGGRPVLDGVTLRVENGCWTTLIGPNGAGKTTLLRAVAGAVANAGSITVNGRELRSLSARARARILALVPQSPVLPSDMTVGEYVLLGRTPHLGMLGRAGKTDYEAVAEAIDRLDLGSLAKRRLDALSGGERQRAVLARTVAQDAPVLLLDEPTTALDIGRQQEVLELIGELRAERGLTVLGAMHDLTLAGQYADRLALLDGGRLVARGSANEVLTEQLIARHYRARVQVTMLGDAPVVFPARLARVAQ